MDVLRHFNHYPTLKMSPAFYVFSFYSDALKNIVTLEARSVLIWVHINYKNDHHVHV